MQMPKIPGGMSLFRYLSDVAYFAKDRQSRFTAANSAFLELVGIRTEDALLGKTDYDVWPAFLAEHYIKDDSQVMHTGSPVVNRVELIPVPNRSNDWFSTTKVPLRDVEGTVVGLEGVARHLKNGKSISGPSTRMPKVIEFIMENYSRKIDIPELAAMVSLSVKQFERKFKQEYGEVPVRYIQNIRLEAARQLLATTTLPISKIGQETGFYDNSHIAHQFQRYAGVSPSEFRKQLKVKATAEKANHHPELAG